MFGVLPYTIDPRTGKPELRQPWAIYRLINWASYATTAAMLALAVYARLKFEEAELVPLVLAAMFASIAFLQHWALGRKKRKYQKALTAWEEGLQRAFDDTKDS